MEDTRKEGVLKPGARDETAASSWALQPGESAGPGGGGARVRLFPAAVCESTAALQLGKPQDDCTEEGQLFLS